AVRVTARDVDALLPHLNGLGFKSTGASAEHHLIEGFAPVAQLPAIGALGPQGLLGVSALPRPVVRRGSVTSQADFAHEADRARATVGGLNGSGQRIGVISDSYNRQGGAAAGVLSGDLPPAVNVFLEGAVGDTDEGRAMIELIYDIAPGADIAFGSASFGETEFAAMVTALADPQQANCQILVDDIGYFTEPFFYEGIVGEAINDVVGRGATFYSAAGNDATQAYESANFNASVDARSETLAHDFDPGPGVDTRQLITIPGGGGALVVLQWDDPFYTQNGVRTDLNIQFLRPGTNTPLAIGVDNNLLSQTPIELVTVINPGFTPIQAEVLIQLAGTPPPGRLKYMHFGDFSINEYATNSATIWGHPMAPKAMAVAAVNYFDQRNPAEFTSAGPNVALFDTDDVRLPVPEIRAKPDFAAIQGTDTTFFGSDVEGNGFANFFGTSAAAPHAAAISALLQQANPALPPDDVYKRMKSTADDTIGDPGPDRLTGAGLINAYDAVFGPASPVTVPFADGLEGGALSGGYETRTSGAGRIGVSGSNLPATGVSHLVLQSMRDGAPSLNEVILRADLTGLQGATLSFRQKEFGDADNPMSPAFTGSEDSDGVALSVNGVDWVRVTSLTGGASTNSYQLSRYNLTAIAAANGLTLGPDTRIKFQQFGSGQAPRAGMAFDDISIENLATVSMGAATVTVNESSGSVQLSVVRAGDPTGSVQVDYASAAQSATTNTDYATTAGSFIFGPGETSKTIDIPIVADSLIEGAETFTVNLSNTVGGVIVNPGFTAVTIADDTVGAAPSNLTATATSTSTVRLAWMDNSTNEDNVEVERRIGLGQFSLIQTLSAGSTSYTDNSLSPDTLYTYRVRAVRGATFTDYSNLASLTISPFRFEEPFFFAFEANGQIVVRVQRSGDILTTGTVELKRTDIEATGGADYQLQDATLTFGPGETTKEIAIPITQDRLLEPAEGFRLTLSDPMGPGSTLGDQSTLTIAIADDRLRTSPRPLTATIVSATSVRVNWTDNCDNETSYRVGRTTGGSPVTIATLPPGTTTFTDNTVTPGIPYAYVATAVLTDLESQPAASDYLFISTVEFVQPGYTVREDDGTIAFLVTRTGDFRETVTLNYATTDGTAVAPGDYGASSGALTFAPLELFKVVFVTIKNDALLEGSETFNIVLSNINGKGTVAGPAGTATVTISDDQSALSPGNLSASVASSTSLRLDWTDRSGNETGFEIQRKTLGGEFATVQAVSANSTTYTDNGLLTGTPYIYRVRSVSAAGSSGFSNEASATTLPPAPAAPTGLSATAQDGGVVRLSWTDNSLNESGFLIERRTGASAFELVATLGENIVLFNDTGLTPGASYSYRVKASNAGGVSSDSNVATVSIPNPPSVPTGLAAAAISSNAVRLTWSHSGVNVTGFRIERQSPGQTFQPVGTVVQGTTEFTDGGVTVNVPYAYRVRATNIGGESEPSNTARAEISSLGKLRVTPAKLKFGKVKANVERTKTFKITNVGKGTLGGLVVGLEQTGGAGGPFTIVSGGEPFTLVRGQVKTVTVRYLSANPGNFQGTITIQSTDTRRDSHTVVLSANTR
ncbi:MAG: Calx-beta domain-containing protein, partial [Actinomycetota bacterium]